MTRTPADRQKPWLLLMEFPSHADASAARELLASQFQEEVILRPKLQFPSHQNIASWRITARLREALSNRTFGREEVDAASLKAGYRAKNNLKWLTAAVRAGVIERIARGEYRFLPATSGSSPQAGGACPQGTSLADPGLLAVEVLMCQGCKPEALSCHAI